MGGDTLNTALSSRLYTQTPSILPPLLHHLIPFLSASTIFPSSLTHILTHETSLFAASPPLISFIHPTSALLSHSVLPLLLPPACISSLLFLSLRGVEAMMGGGARSSSFPHFQCWNICVLTAEHTLRQVKMTSNYKHTSCLWAEAAQPALFDCVETTSRLFFKVMITWILGWNLQMLHKTLICFCIKMRWCEVRWGEVSGEKHKCIFPKFPVLIRKMCVFCVEDASATHPPPIQRASECEPCQILIVAGKWIMGTGRLSVPMAMGRVPLSWQWGGC